ncbi:MAG: hypothetical protein QOJ61_765, partial [Mycobacterium sp.]|nr:hypothetical protein [Mycobacterium sp.]
RTPVSLIWSQRLYQLSYIRRVRGHDRDGAGAP